MKQTFRVQPFRTAAVNAVVGCFDGQPMIATRSHGLDPGTTRPSRTVWSDDERSGYRNGKRSVER